MRKSMINLSITSRTGLCVVVITPRHRCAIGSGGDWRV